MLRVLYRRGRLVCNGGAVRGSQCPGYRTRLLRAWQGLRAVVVAGAAVAAAAGCSPAGPAPADSLAPLQAIRLAAEHARQVNTVSSVVRVRAGEFTVTGTEQVRLAPFGGKLSFRYGKSGAPSQVDEETVTGNALYVKLAATGKQWAKIPAPALPGVFGSTFGQLTEEVRNTSPQWQALLLASAKHPKATGTQVINGVPTTRYVGSVTPSRTLAAASADIQKLLSPTLRNLAPDTVRFTAWIDRQHQVRQLTEVQTISGQPTTTTITVTAINQPITIAPPPPSHVTVLRSPPR